MSIKILLFYTLPIVVILITLVVAYLLNRFMQGIIRRATEDMNNDPTNYKFLRHVILFIVYVAGFGLALFTIPALRDLGKPLLAGTGILAVAAGFAGQHAFSNIISGIFIVLFKPFRINDRLALQTYQGIVEDITLRHTVIRDFENKRIIIPNAVISDEILVNADFAEERICKWIDIGISYDSDIDLGKEIMAQEVLNHPFYIDPRSPEQIDEGVPPVVVRVLLLGESSVNLRAWAWSANAANSFVMSCDLYESIKKRFDKEGVTIPFPHRTVIFKQDKENDKKE